MGMTLYTVYEPPGPRSPESAARTVFLKDGPSFSSVLFPPVWLLWHRLWAGLGLYVLAIIGVATLLTMSSITGFAFVLGAMMPTFWIALEGNDMRRRKLERLGFRQTAAIQAKDRGEAEIFFFARWAAEAAGEGPAPDVEVTAAPVPMPSAPWSSAGGQMPAPRPSGVLGVFPEPGAAR